DIARQPVAVRILLDVHEMIGRRNFQRVRYDPRAAMGRGPESNDLRPERDRPVIAIVPDDGWLLGWTCGRGLVTDHRTFHNLLRRTIRASVAALAERGSSGQRRGHPRLQSGA